MRRLIALFVVTLSMAAGGCATAPPQGSPFEQLQAPSPGSARIYVLRPRYTPMHSGEQPTLFIDSKPLIALQIDQYIDFTVEPGSHVLSLEPGTFDRKVWRRRLTLDVQAGSTYFVAYWANLVPQGGFSVVPGAGGLPFFLLPSNESRLAVVRFEEVSKEDALEALKMLVRVPQPPGASDKL